MVLLLLLGLLPGLVVSQVCDSACQAFQWSFPIWKQAQVRFGQSGTYVCNEFYPFPSPFFNMNNLGKRRSALPSTTQPTPRLAVCNSKLCNPLPNTLSPAPVVAPGIDTIYGIAQLDLSQPQFLTIPPPTLTAPTNPSVFLIGPGDVRYYGVTFSDAYSNVVGAINRITFPLGGRFCLYYNDAQSAICAAAAVHGGFAWQATIKLPRYATALVRAWSSGLPSTNPCVDPQTQQINPGIDGCNFLEFMSLVNLTSTPALLNPWNEFKDLMSPVPGACGSGDASGMPCDHVGGNRNAYWDTICKVLRLTPPSAAEAAYINANFASLGLSADGNCNPNYGVLNVGFDVGYGTLSSVATQKLTGAPKNGWLYLPFTGTWDITQTGLFTRAMTAQRLFYMEPNSVVAYWAKYTDSSNVDLSGAGGAIYKITFPGGPPQVNTQIGFWSMTVYEANWFLHPNPTNKYMFHSNVPILPPTIYLANDCTGAPSGTGFACIPVPAANFRLLFRNYVASANMSPLGSYVNPTVTHCASGSGFC